MRLAADLAARVASAASPPPPPPYSRQNASTPTRGTRRNRVHTPRDSRRGNDPMSDTYINGYLSDYDDILGFDDVDEYNMAGEGRLT